MTEPRRFWILVSQATLSIAFVLLAGSCGASQSPLMRAPMPGDEQPTTAVASAPVSGEAAPDGRLGDAVRPTRYALELTIFPERESFSGRARIGIEVSEPRQLIWLHGDDLEVERATVIPEGGDPIAARYEQVNEQGVASLTLDRSVPKGKAEIDISYRAPFGTQLRGLYRVLDGGKSYAFTQFEATAARSAFPSFDEPAFKTPFDVTHVVHADHVTAGNTPIVSEEAAPDGNKRVKFATTKPMPTYLVAWAVGQLDVVEGEPVPKTELRPAPIPLRGLAVKGKGGQLAYALEHTGKMVIALEEYFGRAYPYEKLDIVAVPDFSAGAMENVGLITFRESLLLLDGDPPEWQKRAYAHVMAHELAHQWFGNLVTMPWWDDIWLNEAFATWMGNKIVERLYPDYHAELSLLESVQRAMRSDSLTSARQIRQPIETNHDISNAFDSITYSKGGGVLSMFERWMGEEVFRTGLRRYMEKHAWKTATADDLLAALSEAAERDIATPFNTFLLQPGLPYVETKLACEEGSAPKVQIRQSRYFPAGSNGDRAKTWQIPVCIRFSAGRDVKEHCEILGQAEGSIALPADACPAWYVPNADASGYFQIGMADEDLAALRKKGMKSLSPREKLALASSVKAAFQAGRMDAAAVLPILEALAKEPVRPVAGLSMDVVGFIENRMKAHAGEAEVQSYARKMVAPLYRQLGAREKPSDDSETKLLRAELIQFLALTAADPAVRRDLAAKGRAYVGFEGDNQLHPDAVSPDLAGIALVVALEDGDEALYDAVEKLLFETQDATVRGRLLSALGSTKDQKLAERARMLALDERLRVNELLTPLSVQMGNEETREAAWQWLETNFDRVVARLGKTGAGWIPWVATSFCSDESAAKVESFFEPRISELRGGPRNLRGAVEAIRLCDAMVEAQRESVAAFFKRPS